MPSLSNMQHHIADADNKGPRRHKRQRLEEWKAKRAQANRPSSVSAQETLTKPAPIKLGFSLKREQPALPRKPKVQLDDDNAQDESTSPGPSLSDVNSSETKNGSAANSVVAAASSAEEDPLETFMNSISGAEMSTSATHSQPAEVLTDVSDEESTTSETGAQADLSEEQETFNVDGFDTMMDSPSSSIVKKEKKKKELGALDHDAIDYEPFLKSFPIRDLSTEEADRNDGTVVPDEELQSVKIRGKGAPSPAQAWAQLGYDSVINSVLSEKLFVRPTAIQSQAMTAILSGRDIIGVAKTGSGKTLAFVLPMLKHISAQRPLRDGEGSIGLILAPTRELAAQIESDCRVFTDVLKLRVASAYGGVALKENIAQIKRGAEILIGTPGRLLELLTMNQGRILSLRRVTYVAIDEADRMFDMGFEPQVMSIVGQTRPDRQTVLFSATFPRQMEALARKILTKPLEIVCGGRAVVASEIEQTVKVVDEESKFLQLLKVLGAFYKDRRGSKTLIFVDRQESTDQLLHQLIAHSYMCMSIHGGRDQGDREQALADFKEGVTPILIATSIAARGLDVKNLDLVINYDVPNHLEDYVHRAGRTGRAGRSGQCVTFITPEQDKFAGDIVRALEMSKAVVSQALRDLADEFAKKNDEHSKRSSGFGGKGLDRLQDERKQKTLREQAAYGDIQQEEDEQTSKEQSAIAASQPDEEFRQPQQKDNRTRDAVQRAQALVASLNAQVTKLETAKPAKPGTSGTVSVEKSLYPTRKRDPLATDHHATIYINDYPQEARWSVTNKDMIMALSRKHGVSITQRGQYFPPGRIPRPNDPPKLHLLLECNQAVQIQKTISEIKSLLMEGAIVSFGGLPS